MKLLVCFAFLSICNFSCGKAGWIGNLLHRERSTTEKPRPLFINNNVPSVEPGCTINFECKKKLMQAVNPRPCTKYCVKTIVCPNKVKTRGKPNQCVELDETQVMAEYEASRAQSAAQNGEQSTESIMQVAMIDFPCQPGYLPDSRGRCREIW